MRIESLLLALLGLMLGELLPGNTARADTACPPALVKYRYSFRGGDTPIEAIAFDSTVVNADGDTTRLAFDRAAGRLSIVPVGRVWAGVRVQERFDLAGVPEGTAVSAVLQFELDGDLLNRCGGGGCGVYFSATLGAGLDSLVLNANLGGPCDSCTRDIDTTIELPVTLTAGSPRDVFFVLLYHTTNVAWGLGDVTGVYRVAGLPPGVRAVACHGADVTPTRRASWGAVKSRYQ